VEGAKNAHTARETVLFLIIGSLFFLSMFWLVLQSTGSVECQKQDWKQHKLYCHKPPTYEEELAGVQKVAKELGIPWDLVEANAKKPLTLDSIAESMNELQAEFYEQMTGVPSASRFKNDPPADWEGIDLDALMQLPTVSSSRSPTSTGLNGMADLFASMMMQGASSTLVISFATFGTVDHKTGKLVYMISVCEQGSGGLATTKQCNGKPTNRILEWAISV
jgi:hypothetical protein